MPIGITGARHPSTPQQPWIYTFYLNHYVDVVDGAGARWRLGVRANVHVTSRRVYSPQLGRWRTEYRNVPGNTFVPGYDCWSMQTPPAIVARAPAYDPATHGHPQGQAWGNPGDFYVGANRYPLQY
jgi:hypothetical protein